MPVSPTHDGDVARRLLEVVFALAREINPRHVESQSVTLDSRLDKDLSIDSLGRVELLARLEDAFSITLAEEAVMEADTPRDLLRALAQSHGRKAFALGDVEQIRLGRVGEIPEDAKTLVEVLDWHAARHPDRPHIRLYDDQSEGEVITYGALKTEAMRMASGLAGRGIGVGDAVVIMLPTGRDYFVTFMGVLMAGGIPVPVYPPGRASQVEEHLLRHAQIVDNCQAALMVVMEEATRFAQVLRARAPALLDVLTPGAVVGHGAGNDAVPRIVETDTALLQYTSGSTGAPKGVVLSHANLLANIRAMGRALEVASDDVFVSWLPLYHDMGLIGAWLGSLYHAVPLVSMSPLAFIARPLRWLTAIHRFGGTLSAAPNFAYELCVSRIKDEDLAGLDLSTWRQTLNGAEAVSVKTCERFAERFAPYGFGPEVLLPVYGLAECSVGLTFPPIGRTPRIDAIARDALMTHGRAEAAMPDDETPLRLASCGVPLPGHFIRIIDAAGFEVPERREGRIQFRGPSATSGYLRAPDKTRELFDGPWLETGDMGYQADGEVFITGRVKDIVIRAGRNIYPEELEEAVGRIDGVRSGGVAVFACLDEASGTERLVVLAETRKRAQDAQDAQRAEINAIVTDLTGTPADDIVLAPPNTVPKTSSGKVRRAASRDIYVRGAIGKVGKTSRVAVWWQVLRFTLGAWKPQARRIARGGAAWLYAAYCWAVFALAAAPLWFTLVALPGQRARWSVGGAVLRTLMRLCAMRLSVSGGENLPPDGGPVVVVSNHQSYLDALVLVALLPRPVRFVAKAELAGNVFTRVLLERFECVFVERLDSALSAHGAEALVETARGGATVLFFAEGTFSRRTGVLPFRLGPFETAQSAGRAVVPVAIRGTRQVLRGSSWFPRPGAVSVTIGGPIRAEGDGFEARLELSRRARAWILAHAGEPDLGGEAYGVPGEDVD